MVKQRPTNKSYKRYEKDSGDSSGEETELFVRNKSPKKEIPTVEKNIEDGDTLQSLAIRYHCTIEELKRLNQIHKDNEIFARRTIKVPHRPFSEALASVHVSGTTSPHEHEPSTSKLIDIDSLDTKLESIKKKDNEVNEIIFNSNIAHKPINTIEDETIFDAEEDVHLLPQTEPQEVDSVISRISCNGSDGDISLPALIICIFIVIFAAPLIYVFYIAENNEINHNHTDLSGK